LEKSDVWVIHFRFNYAEDSQELRLAQKIRGIDMTVFVGNQTAEELFETGEVIIVEGTFFFTKKTRKWIISEQKYIKRVLECLIGFTFGRFVKRIIHFQVT
jgi:hypothetical protein